MPTANANILRDTVRLALQSSGVAAAADIDPDVWATDPDEGGHVFDGDGGLHRGRNRGRLPFVEFWLASQDAHQLAYDGGTLDSVVTVRVHVGGRDQAVAESLAHEIAFQCVAAIRDLPANGYAFLGDERFDAFKTGPWGHQLDVQVTVKQVYGREDVAAPPVVVQRGDPAPGVTGEEISFVGENVGAVTILPGQPVARVSTGVRLAWAADTAYECVALAGAEVAAGAAADMVTQGQVGLLDWSDVTEDGSEFLTPGAPYYLAVTAGKITATAPSASGQIAQQLGVATDAQTLDLNIQQAVEIA